MNKLISKYIPYIVLAALIYMPIFGHLDTVPIRIWDEARCAMNAYELLHNNDFIVTHYEGEPDMWNTKPPLLIWIQAAFIKVMGFNELAVRLPSAFAALLTCITLLIFFLRYLKNFWFGFITVLILVTSQGYISLHGTRTGDYDAMLTLFTTLSALCFFAYCETNNNKRLYLFFAFTALAVLTKSVTGLFFLPAMLIYSVIQKQFMPLLKNKHFYYGLLSFLAVVVGYYLLREVNNPGFIAAVQENELGGRYLEVIENHEANFWFYFNNFINYQLSPWYILIPCGIILGLVSKDLKVKRITLFSLLMTSTFLIVISASQTKLAWYDVPLYPFLSILIAVFVHFIFELFRQNKWMKETLTVNIFPFLFLFLLFIYPYERIIDKTYKPKERSSITNFYEIGYFLKDAVKGKYDLNDQYLLYQGHRPHIRFYIIVLSEKGIRFAFKDREKLDKEDVVIACQINTIQYVEENYIHEKIKTVGKVITYKILGRK